MPISVSCSACNVRLTLGDDRAGDRFECPNCDAIIKVPGPSQPPARAAGGAVPLVAAAPSTRAPAPPPQPEPEDLPDDLPEDLPDDPVEEPRGMDRRVLVGIIAGAAALVLVGVAAVALAVREPAAVAKRDEPAAAPAPAPVAPPQPATNPTDKPGTVLPQKGGPGDPVGKQPSGGGPAPKTGPVQPPPPPPVLLDQFSATFLGSQGKGRRFCIIADNSGSMGGAKLANLKVQLNKTLTDLNAEGEFYVCFFNSKAEPMPHPTWVKAGSPEAEKMRAWVNGVRSTGGTVPAPAFDVAFKLDPPPDLIFFMTDGEFANTVAAKVAALNGTPRKAVVNTIMFGRGPPPKAPPVAPRSAEAQLRLIADQNGGTFTFYTP